MCLYVCLCTQMFLSYRFCCEYKTNAIIRHYYATTGGRSPGTWPLLVAQVQFPIAKNPPATHGSCCSRDGSVSNKLCWGPPQYVPVPCKLTFDLLTLKVVSESRVTRATSVPISISLGLSVLDLGPTYVATDRQTSDAHHRLMPPTLGVGA